MPVSYWILKVIGRGYYYGGTLTNGKAFITCNPNRAKRLLTSSSASSTKLQVGKELNVKLAAIEQSSLRGNGV